ncbi:hypothetical protein BT96DRAFT_890310 [Gymnopus androsaceus JB14]|uniref:Ubiquitin 3 binding protein But2 C-terminal domain-containing protein n=1 Tax=Gymnopus androsaceus JB14 TaxID=1447944 RepID=A0A6A4GUZ2_9AGAR|nr:hypothetical protein BT96DRAFT_890310 [Gymnopus androsaceus JB14]
MSRQSEYTSLPQEMDDDTDRPKDNSHGKLYKLIYWSSILIVLCTVFDGVLLSILAYRYSFVLNVPSLPATKPLERVSTYINFDRLYKNQSIMSSPRGPIISLTRSQAHVSSADPIKVFPQSTASWMTYVGTVPVSDRRLWANSNMATIMQSRVLDYGMESCRLTISIPHMNDTALISSELDINGSRLEVWTLSTDARLDVGALSWNTKPVRSKYLGSIRLAYGETHQLGPWSCSAGSYQTFEFVCPAEVDCRVDVTTVGESQIGVYLMQYQTA